MQAGRCQQAPCHHHPPAPLLLLPCVHLRARQLLLQQQVLQLLRVHRPLWLMSLLLGLRLAWLLLCLLQP
jgi:hypothetical protein